MGTDQLGTAYQPAGRLSFKQAAIVFWLVVAALFAGQWSIPVTDRDEARYAQATTQMMETGDYIDIRFQEKPRYVKPAGIYWMMALASQPFGGPDAPIGAFRLPSYIGAVLSCLMTAWLGARILGGAGGALAGGILGLSFLVGMEGRWAKTDAMLMAAGTLSQLALFMILVQPKGSPPGSFRTWPFLFWFGSGLALLIKGPIVAIATVSTLVFYLAFTRDWRALRRLRPLLGIVVFAVVGLSWVTLITVQSDGEFLRESVGHALFGKVSQGDDAHGGPFGYHTALLPATLWPGIGLFFLGAIAAWKQRGEPAMIFLLAWLVPTWIVFEIVATKLPHYIMPAFPALAIIVALGVRDASSLLSSGLAKFLHGIGILLFVLIGLVLAVLPFVAVTAMSPIEPVPEAWLFAPQNVAVSIAALLTILVGVFVLIKPTVGKLAWGSLPVILLYTLLFEAAIPRLDAMWPSREVAKIASQLEGCDDFRVATAGYREPSNVFYFGTNTALTDGDGAAAFLLEEGGCALAVVDRRETDAFAAALNGTPVRSFGMVRGKNVSKGRSLELTLYVLADSPLQRGEGTLRRL